jgi:hypothetical protein
MDFYTLNWKWVSWRTDGVDLMTQMVKKVKKTTEEMIVKENTNNLVSFKEKLLCLSVEIEKNALTKSQRQTVQIWCHGRLELGRDGRPARSTGERECPRRRERERERERGGLPDVTQTKKVSHRLLFYFSVLFT